jgi:transposase
MMTQETEKVRKQMQMVCIDDLVPRNHLLRLIDKAIDWTFIYDLVRDTYSDGKYSLQGTTQGRYLTGGVPLVRFSM